jgi:hypothetical protein
VSARYGARRFREKSLHLGMFGLPPIFLRQIDRLAVDRGRLEELSDDQLKSFLSLYTWAQWPRIFVFDVPLGLAHWMLWRTDVQWSWPATLTLWLMMMVPMNCALLVFGWHTPRPRYRAIRIWWIRRTQLAALALVVLGFLLTEILT